MRYSIYDVASVITEDPDILTELDASLDKGMDEQPVADPGAIAATTPEPEDDRSVVEPEVGEEKPLSAIDIERQAQEIGGPDPDAEVVDQVQAQEEAERQMALERQRLLAPQMDELRGSMDTLGAGITQGAAGAQAGGEAFAGLDTNMAKIQAILGQLENQLY